MRRYRSSTTIDISDALAKGQRLAAIMFLDMVGDGLPLQHNEASAGQFLEGQLSLVRDSLPRYNGRETATPDGAFSVEFDDALEAVRCAMEIQQLAFERNQSRPRERHIMPRIGIHLGDTVRGGAFAQGDGVDLAARIGSLASPGGICISEDVAQQIRTKFNVPLTPVGKRQRKNIESPVKVYRVALPWENRRKVHEDRIATEAEASTKRSGAKDRRGSNTRSSGLLESKLYAPCPHSGIVPRSRLIGQLKAGLSRRLTLISAPAGFGKTTLLTAWKCSADRQVCWVSLDENDNNPSTFWSYVIAALQTLNADLGQSAAALLNAQMRQPQHLRSDAFLTPLVNEIGALSDNIVLVLEDYHFISNPVIHEGLGFLLEHLSPRLHMIITSRADPPLPLSRMRARNQLSELRARDLRFDTDEAAVFLNEVMGLHLSTENISDLEARTEGWIVGLQLAALSIQGRDTKDVGDFITAFAGSHRFVVDYLAEEVFNTQPENIRRFLLHTSILHRLSGPLCDAVTGQTDSAAILAHLERNNLFTIPLDEHRQWYRYHQLFADVLRHRLESEHPELVPGLHRRASNWFEESGLVTEAMTHSLAARDFGRAARLVEADSAAMISRGETNTLLSWLDSLPVELVRSRPRLSIAKAWATVSQDRMQEANECLGDAERWAANEGSSSPEAHEIIGEAAAVRAMIGVMLDDAPCIILAAEKALQYLPAEQRYLRGIVSMNLAVAHMLLGDFSVARRVGDEALRVGHAIGNKTLQYYAYFCLAGIERMQSHLRRSAHALRKALDAVQTPDGGYLPIATLAHRYLAEMLYEWNDVESAHRHITLSLELGQSWWVRDEMIKSYVLLARIQRARGDTDAMHSALKQAEELSDDRYAFNVLARVGLPSVKEWLANGFLQSALRWGEKEPQIFGFDSDLTIHQSSRRSSLARLFLAQGKPALALEAVETLRPTAESKQITITVIDSLVLESLALQARDDVPRAIDSLNRALSLARPERYVRTFLDEGEAMQALLRRVTGENRQYAAALLGVFDTPREHGAFPEVSAGNVETSVGVLVEQLSRRELELMQHLGEGLSNQEIAQKLYISVDTVKVHLKRIYQKLGVNNRTQATIRARALNLL